MHIIINQSETNGVMFIFSHQQFLPQLDMREGKAIWKKCAVPGWSGLVVGHRRSARSSNVRDCSIQCLPSSSLEDKSQMRCIALKPTARSRACVAGHVALCREYRCDI